MNKQVWEIINLICDVTFVLCGISGIIVNYLYFDELVNISFELFSVIILMPAVMIGIGLFDLSKNLFKKEDS